MFPKNLNPELIKNAFENTMMEHLNIEIDEIGDDFISATMPVGPRTHQPLGYLHGGASLALAESLGSMASYLLIDVKNYNVFGLEINANHIKSKKTGVVKATARPIHLGRQTHIWDIRIEDEEKTLISIARLTNIITPQK
jgi:1,4-dihydroxy-2-naphthoyl-CoA hydrolase